MLVNKKDRAEYYKKYNAANREKKRAYYREYDANRRDELNKKVIPMADNRNCRLARRFYWIMDMVLKNDNLLQKRRCF